MSASSDRSASPTTNENPVAKRGRDIADLMAAGKFSDVAKLFDATMSQALPEAKLAATWQGILQGAGEFGGVVASRAEKAGPYDTAIVTCKFGSTLLDLKLAFDQHEKITGFFITPTPAAWSPPAYADTSKVTEREVVVNPGAWELPGTLTLPNGAGPFAAVVLVHGSGPNDRDESIGPNKPFKDLALGLATRGVAVLRFEKRTKAHGPKIDVATFKLDDESVDDAVAAVELLSKETAIDQGRIFVLGHSLGGTFAPRIAGASKKVAKIALLAGATRSVPEMIIEQMKYIGSLDGKESAEEKAALEAVRKASARIKELQGGAEPKPGEVLLGAAAPYWIELGKYDPVATMKAVSVPVFVGQGGRDYQVTETDYRAWETALAGHKNATLKLYPALNHLFIHGTGKSTPEEYAQLGHMDDQVIADLAVFFGS